jgi:hypothetical protein
MNLDALYQRVTEAILAAEAIGTKGPSVEVSQAYLTDVEDAILALDIDALGAPTGEHADDEGPHSTTRALR